MLGLAVLFFLGLWIIITIAAMVIGSKFGRKPATKLLGAFLGFMLTMGGFIVYWTIEYYQIKNYVTNLCESEGGVKVYVTPEEFKERLRTNNWQGLPKYTVLPKGDEKNNEYIIFEGKEFKGFEPNATIPEITIYRHMVRKRQLFTIYREKIYVFNQPKVILTKYTSVFTSVPAVANNLAGLKFWINDIRDCDTDYHSVNDNKFSLYEQELKNE